MPAAPLLSHARAFNIATTSSGIGNIRFDALDFGVPVKICLPLATRFSTMTTVLAFRSTLYHLSPAISPRRRPYIASVYRCRSRLS